MLDATSDKELEFNGQMAREAATRQQGASVAAMVLAAVERTGAQLVVVGDEWGVEGGVMSGGLRVVCGWRALIACRPALRFSAPCDSLWSPSQPTAHPAAAAPAPAPRPPASPQVPSERLCSSGRDGPGLGQLSASLALTIARCADLQVPVLVVKVGQASQPASPLPSACLLACSLAQALEVSRQCQLPPAALLAEVSWPHVHILAAAHTCIQTCLYKAHEHVEHPRPCSGRVPCPPGRCGCP